MILKMASTTHKESRKEGKILEMFPDEKPKKKKNQMNL